MKNDVKYFEINGIEYKVFKRKTLRYEVYRKHTSLKIWINLGSVFKIKTKSARCWKSCLPSLDYECVGGKQHKTYKSALNRLIEYAPKSVSITQVVRNDIKYVVKRAGKVRHRVFKYIPEQNTWLYIGDIRAPSKFSKKWTVYFEDHNLLNAPSRYDNYEEAFTRLALGK